MINERLKNIFEILDEMQSLISKYLDSLNASDANYEEYEILNRFNKSVIPKFRLTINTYSSLFENEIFYETVMNDLESMAGSFRYNVMNLDGLEAHQTLSNMVNSARNIQEIKKDLQMMRATSLRFEELIEPAIDKALNQIKNKVDKVDAAILAIEQHETDKIYLGLYNKYNKEYVFNNIFFYTSIFFGIFFTYYSTIELTDITNPTVANYQSYQNFWIKFITIKFLILSATVTFATLFLRRLSHAKKLKEQAYQTHVEISAFPIHVRSLKEEDKHELVKELTMKYFGKELDQTQNDKIGDLMQDQLVAGTELIKASAELVKSVKPSALADNPSDRSNN
ncbi:hypothetical protein F909_00985 [Acinetobacter sp. ANC 3929]|uniref:hypothetical protein n=1 Tax=unclassified Acinetobacter TaxID=196816 RepID=UPI0002CDDE6D|nr:MULTISPECIES: hypothetical protein [unclassified Acinetobacter]ENW82714.1 hypothetical protein F909_00985 [Acinetobacter sp. ANC 3929]MCH7356238.1 hypothetical protein [Acinetobacter sp. NIPH 1958]